jgi:ribosomal protein S18 acetylase RimI-like enzyme
MVSHDALSGEQAGAHVSAYTHEMQPGQYYLRNLAVSSEHRGRGIGTQFMQELARRHDEAGTSVTLHCRHDLVPWYQKLGFEEQGEDDFGHKMMRKPR